MIAFDGEPSAERLTSRDIFWDPLLPQVKLRGNTVNAFPVDGMNRVTHLRLNIFPDGGVARLRVHGHVVPAEVIFQSADELDLAAMENGAFVVSCSDMHYGNRQNLILPGRSTHMGDGWETKRRRGPGHDWAIVRLARRGVIHRVKLDTDHFKGNAPGSCMLGVLRCWEIVQRRHRDLESARAGSAALSGCASPVGGSLADAGNSRKVEHLPRWRRRAAAIVRPPRPEAE